MESPSSGSEPVEFNLARWPSFVLWFLFVWSVACVFYLSNWGIPFRWPVVSALIAISLAIAILRNSPWSPFYLGPTLRVDSTRICGPGGWFHPAWRVTWSQFARAEAGRNGIFIYRNDVEPWREPLMQVGPFNYAGGSIVKIINRRAGLFKQYRNIPDGASSS
jgi:hypothetical protein